MRRCLGSKERRGQEEHRRRTDAGVFPGRLSDQIPTARHNPAGVFPHSALHRETPSATNRGSTLAQALRRMQASRPVGSSMRPLSLLRPVVRRVSRRVLHPNLVAKHQLPAVPPLQAQQAHANQAQDERKKRVSSRKRIPPVVQGKVRSEEHTSELQSRENLVCRLLLEKKK